MGTLAALGAGLAVVLAASSGQARQDNPRLEELFAELQSSADSAEVEHLEAEIWRIWLEAGDEALDRQMALGIRAVQRGRLETALEHFDEIVEADPKFAEGWNKRATVYYLMGRYEDSARDARRTLELEPRHFGALSGMGLIHDALDDDEAALAWFERALDVNPHMEGVKQRVKTLRRELRGRAI